MHYEKLFRQQYLALGQADRFRYHVHDGGDDMPAKTVIAWFQEQFKVEETRDE